MFGLTLLDPTSVQEHHCINPVPLIASSCDKTLNSAEKREGEKTGHKSGSSDQAAIRLPLAPGDTRDGRRGVPKQVVVIIAAPVKWRQLQFTAAFSLASAHKLFISWRVKWLHRTIFSRPAQTSETAGALFARRCVCSNKWSGVVKPKRCQS